MQQATLSPPHIDFKKERTFSEKINVTFAFLSQNFKPLALNLLLVAGPFSLLGGLFYGMYQSVVLGGGMLQNPMDFPFTVPSVVGSLIGMIIFSFLAGSMVIAVVLRHIKSYVELGHCNLQAGELWNSIWKDFFNVIGTSFFLTIGLTFTSFVIIIPIALLGASSPNVALMIIGGLILSIGAFLLMPALLLIYPIRTMERRDVFSSTSRMFHIVSGKWLSTLGIVVVSVIIQTIIAVIFTIPMYIVMFLQAFHTQKNIIEGTNNGSTYQVLLTVSSGISMLGTYTLYSILFVAITFQYFSLVERKDSTGLLERMEGFGQLKVDADEHDEQY